MGNPIEDKILRRFEKAHSVPNAEIEGMSQETGLDDLDKKVTVLDFQGIPAQYLESMEGFLNWYEPRFGNLRSEEDLERASAILKEALEIYEAKPYLVPYNPAKERNIGVSVGIRNQIKRGFQSLEEIRGFFRKTRVDISEPKGQKDILVPDKKSRIGAERLSACQLLKLGFMLDVIKNNQDFEKFLEYAKFALGRNEDVSGDSGIFASLVVLNGESIDVLRTSAKDQKILEWTERGKDLGHCRLNNFGKNGKSYFFTKVLVGVKGGMKSLMKLLRDPQKENLRFLDDFFRMTFVFSDDKTNAEIVEFLMDVEEEAKKKSDPQIKIEFRLRNYLDDEELEDLFPDRDPESDIIRGALDEAKLFSNPNSGGGYKNISMKISFIDPKSQKKFFSFEAKVMRERELFAERDLESLVSQFSLKMRELVQLFARQIGPMKKEEVVEKIREFLISKEMPYGDIPGKMRGLEKETFKKNGQRKRKQFEVELRDKSPEEAAGEVFDFLLREGVLSRVTVNFPTIKKPTDKQKKTSESFIFTGHRDKILKFIGAEVKEKKE